MLVDRIERFEAEYRFLSNFYPVYMKVAGVEYPTLEHAYQAAKATSVEDADWVRRARTPGEAKQRGQKILCVRGWDEMKLDVMRGLLELKFDPQGPERGRLWKMLDATGDAELIEGNHWGDTFWGVTDGEGQNWLGRLLMDVRAQYRNTSGK